MLDTTRSRSRLGSLAARLVVSSSSSMVARTSITLASQLPSVRFLPRLYSILTHRGLEKQLATNSRREEPLTYSRLRGKATSWELGNSITGFQCLPLNNFKYFLTLFSKFFSSFPHGTCSLSVSRQYLALDEIYHPFRTAFPSNSTLGSGLVRGELQVKDGILTLSDTLFQKIYTQVETENASTDYNSESPLGAPILTLSSSRFTRRY